MPQMNIRVKMIVIVNYACQLDSPMITDTDDNDDEDDGHDHS